jgi:pyrimidine precursor biosynthesis enzyme
MTRAVRARFSYMPAPLPLWVLIEEADVTEIIGSGKVDLGFKAMIHTLAAKARGFPVTSIGSLLDEPFTGVVYLNDSGITTDFRSLKGKKIGYVGEFGKV